MIAIGVMLALCLPARAMSFEAPVPSGEAYALMPQEADSFAQGLWNICKAAIAAKDGPLREAMQTCLGVSGIVLFCSVLCECSSSAAASSVRLACCVLVAEVLLEPSTSLIQLGTQTGADLSAYGTLLLPVMSGSLAAQGGVTASAALYAGTAAFNSILSQLMSHVLPPMLYLFLALSLAHRTLAEPLLADFARFLSWGMGWVLKLVLYLFTGYMTVTGVVSGTADAAALRAAKITISGVVPVVGGILSDASEMVLVTAGTLGSSAGVYGMLAVLAIFAAPFLRIGIHYLLLKATACLCVAFDGGSGAQLIGDFASGMGLVLAMVGSQTILLMISTLCFMKGVG